MSHSKDSVSYSISVVNDCTLLFNQSLAVTCMMNSATLDKNLPRNYITNIINVGTERVITIGFAAGKPKPGIDQER
uniref:Uncharacterized protein n=1 Tax=Anguilla anguilla TaxID=7936 RepID=A0A0E9SXQ0_ANGAN